jgi:hypothetical protein
MRLRNLAPSPALVVACVALAISLGGVGYAAVTIPRASVGTPQLKDNAVTGAKVKKDTLTGLDVNEASLKGLLKTGAIAAENGSPAFMYTAPAATEADVTETTITLAKPGKIFMLGRVIATLTCKIDGPCDTAYALFVDGDVANGSQTPLFAEAGETAASGRLTLFAVSPTLPAGQHTITMKRSTTHPYIQSNDYTSRNLAAVAIGG